MFIKNNAPDTDAPNVIGSSSHGKFVNDKRQIKLSEEQMQSYYNCLLKNKSNITAEKHVENIKQMKLDVDSNVCPHCGGKLTKRNGKYGEFWGCENYPHCKFIKK